MVSVIRTNSDNPDFIALVKLLDAELAIRDGQDHAFYAAFNKIDGIKHAVVAYDRGEALACGAIKQFTAGMMEVKRMYVSPAARKKGVATRVLSELETWAREMGCSGCVLETGRKQPEAIGLYEKNGYRIIPNYGQYAGVTNSVCYEKKFSV